VRLTLVRVYLSVLDSPAQVQIDKLWSDYQCDLHFKNVEDLGPVLEIDLDVALTCADASYKDGLIVLAEPDLDYVGMTELYSQLEPLTYPVGKLVMMLVEEVNRQ